MPSLTYRDSFQCIEIRIDVSRFECPGRCRSSRRGDGVAGLSRHVGSRQCGRCGEAGQCCAEKNKKKKTDYSSSLRSICMCVQDALFPNTTRLASKSADRLCIGYDSWKTRLSISLGTGLVQSLGELQVVEVKRPALDLVTCVPGPFFSLFLGQGTPHHPKPISSNKPPV